MTYFLKNVNAETNSVKKKVILQQGYYKYKPLSKNGSKWLHNKQIIFEVSRDPE